MRIHAKYDKKRSSSPTASRFVQKTGVSQESYQLIDNRPGTIQRLGRKGHMAVGGAIGSVVPVLGTAIGAYVGNQIYNKKKRRRLARGQRTATHQAPVNANDLRALRQKIETTRGSIQGGNYQQAADDLKDNAELAALGLTLKVEYAIGSNPVGPISKNNMFYPGSGLVKITFPIANDWSNADDSRKILFMNLEEYIHAYQHLSNSFLSPTTSAYKSTNQAQQAAARAGGEGYDFDEIDAMAYYQDVGENVEDLDYVDRYQERRDYYAWRNG